MDKILVSGKVEGKVSMSQCDIEESGPEEYCIVLIMFIAMGKNDH